MAVVNNTEDRENFQNDINSLNEWCNKWLIKLNLDKCKIMHIGKNNNQYEYNTMNGKFNQILKTTTLERDIGVNISNDLKWEHHIKLIVNKANSKLGLLAKSFRYKNKQLIKSLYCTFVRPLLEFAVPVWCPYLEKDISKLEKVQHRATKLAPEIRHLPYNERLKRLGLTTLVDRRTRGDLIQQYKIYHEFDNINWYSKQDYASSLATNGPASNVRGHNARLALENITQCNQRENFYLNRVAKYWNKLPSEAINAGSVNQFKNIIDKLNYRFK